MSTAHAAAGRWKVMPGTRLSVGAASSAPAAERTYVAWANGARGPREGGFPLAQSLTSRHKGNHLAPLVAQRGPDLIQAPARVWKEAQGSNTFGSMRAQRTWLIALIDSIMPHGRARALHTGEPWLCLGPAGTQSAPRRAAGRSHKGSTTMTRCTQGRCTHDSTPPLRTMSA